MKNLRPSSLVEVEDNRLLLTAVEVGSISSRRLALGEIEDNIILIIKMFEPIKMGQIRNKRVAQRGDQYEMTNQYECD